MYPCNRHKATKNAQVPAGTRTCPVGRASGYSGSTPGRTPPPLPKKRTLTNLYNERPAWLANAHRALDEAVAAAYGFSADLSDDDLLARLLELNLSRAGAAAAAVDEDDED